MPAKTEKQKRFFGAVMGAKKGQSSVTGAAKKVAKEMPEKEVKKFLKKENFDTTVNNLLEKFFKNGMTLDKDTNIESI
jgi:hypothetical protein